MTQTQGTNNSFNPPVAQQGVLEENNTFTFSWYQWLATKVARGLFAPVSSSAPASSAAAGAPGQISFDENFIYVCIQPNLWKRSPLTAF
jgi:hypothetical protein